MKTPLSPNIERIFAIFMISHLTFLTSVDQTSGTLPTPSVGVSQPKNGSTRTADNGRTLVWGIPRSTCAAYGAKYDTTSGLSEWNPKLVLEAKSPSKIAGTLIGGTRELQFSSQLDGKSAIQSLIIKSRDMSFSISASPTVENQFEIKIGKPSRETVYVYRYLETGIQIIKGTPESVKEEMDKWDASLLFPLLAYKLGVEMGVVGKIYPAALPIYRAALSVSKKKNVQVFKMRDRDRDNPHIPDDTDEDTDEEIITPVGNTGGACTDQKPGNRAQECYGQCGPFWFEHCICWDFVCGDCCCYAYCRDHDAACACGDSVACAAAIPDFASGQVSCEPCNDPGYIQCVSGSSAGNMCPSGQFYCPHSGRCQATGSECHPKCETGTEYCSRLRRCVRKSECNNARICPPGYVLFNGRCTEMAL